jgi:hypothetical protein
VSTILYRGISEYSQANDFEGSNLGAANSKSRMLMIDPNVGFFSPAVSRALLSAASSTSGKGPETGPK